MWKTLPIFTCASFLSLLLLLLMEPAESATRRSNFYEGVARKPGSRCRLANGGGKGKCVKMVNCPEKLVEVRTGRYNILDRCGFLKDDEIVCCEMRQRSARKQSKNTKRRPRRAAVSACKNYKKEISEIWDTTLFFSVVFNGIIAKPGEFPHMAALGYDVSEDEAPGGRLYVCGGTLISKKHILTAAHCVSNVNNMVPVEVLLGVTDLVVVNKRQIQRFSISKITTHPLYRRSFHYHDIAVLELNETVKFTAFVKPTCLTTKRPRKKKASSNLVVLGWGSVDIDGTLSNKLLKATKLNFVRKNECSETYSHARAKIPVGLDEGMICVRDSNVTRKADTCWGDSGGPLLGASTPYPPLVGITSFGVACGAGAPGVYASVYKYLSWIEDQVWPKAS